MKGLSSKNNREFWIYIILGIFCWIVFFHFAKDTFIANKRATISVFSTSVKSVEKKSSDALLVYKILKEVENENINSAEENINDFLNTDNNSYMKEYFRNFVTYTMEPKSKNRRPIYFFNEMPVITEYMVSNHKESAIDAASYAEVIPFYILKKYEKNNKGASNLCDIYINNVTKNNHLTKKAAIVLCLKIRRIYEEDGLIKNSERLKGIQDLIVMYKQQYPNELNNNPSFMDEIKWLDTFDKFLTDRINNPVMGILSRITFNKNIKGLGE